jgi:uncharacterized protein YqgV (UPF0045/DUF77 family)
MVSAQELKKRQQKAFEERQATRSKAYKEAREAQYRKPKGFSRGESARLKRSPTRKVQFRDPVSGRIIRAKVRKGPDMQKQIEELIRSIAVREIKFRLERGQKVPEEQLKRFGLIVKKAEKKMAEAKVELRQKIERAKEIQKVIKTKKTGAGADALRKLRAQVRDESSTLRKLDANINKVKRQIDASVVPKKFRKRIKRVETLREAQEERFDPGLKRISETVRIISRQGQTRSAIGSKIARFVQTGGEVLLGLPFMVAKETPIIAAETAAVVESFIRKETRGRQLDNIIPTALRTGSMIKTPEFWGGVAGGAIIAGLTGGFLKKPPKAPKGPKGAKQKPVDFKPPKAKNAIRKNVQRVADQIRRRGMRTKNKKAAQKYFKIARQVDKIANKKIYSR